MTRVRSLLARSFVLAAFLLGFGANVASADPGSGPKPTAGGADASGYGALALPDDAGYGLDNLLLPDDPDYPY